MNDSATYNSNFGQLIEPETIAYSFNTPGWYLLLALLLLGALIVVFVQYRKYHKNDYRRQAIQEIESIIQQKRDNAVFEINELLKTVTIQLYGREKVAALYGEEWFRFLQSSTKSEANFPDSLFVEITKVLYNNSVQLAESQFDEFILFAKNWILKHEIKNV